jgi:Fur family peroxide stress response transcriptional regulator
MKLSHPHPDVASRLQQMVEKLRTRAFRITPQRLAVLEVLAASANHPSVEMIFEQVRERFPTTSLATVYKTVALLKEVHEVLELGFPDRGNRYDGHMPHPHPHLICTRCGTILDPDLDGLTDLTQELAAATGFQIRTHRLDFFGICRDCQEAG